MSEYDVSKYVEVIFNSSLGKILGNIKYVYWLSKGDLRSFALRNYNILLKRCEDRDRKRAILILSEWLSFYFGIFSIS